MAADDYRWSRLPDNQIRILTLKAGAADDAIHFDLTKHPLGKLPPYEALSYAWGDAERDSICHCQDEISSRIFKVTGHLFQALRQLRQKDKNRRLWIDQICIAQTDQEEKPRQVRLMSTIYRQAEQVVVWLGPADSETSLVFSLIENTGQQCFNLITQQAYDVSDAHSYPPLELTSADTPAWVAYRQLLRRAWFTRVWTFQELALSKSAVIVCGGRSVGWKAFLLVLDSVKRFDKRLRSIESHVKEEDRLCSELEVCNNTLKHFENSSDASRQYLTLIALVASCMGQQTGVPSDKIYGLLGLAQDIDERTFPIIYEQHFRDTYIHASRLFIEQHGDLNVLKLVILKYLQLNSSRYGPGLLPSWVPDFRFGFTGRNATLKFSRMDAAKHGRNRNYNASGASRATLSNDEYGQLTLQGIHVDRIRLISKEDGNMTGGHTIGLNILPGGQWPQLAEQAALDGVYSPTREPIRLAFQRLYIRDYMPNDFSPEIRRRRLNTPIAVPEPGTSSMVSLGPGANIFNVAQGDIAIQIVAATTNRRLVVTDSGYIGLVHRSCVVGDFIFILMGGDMPCVLRKVETGTYAFQGEAYVHGIMDGEFLLKYFSPHRPSSTLNSDAEEWLDSLDGDPLPFDTERLVLS